jgi:hypothetical protein
MNFMNSTCRIFFGGDEIKESFSGFRRDADEICAIPGYYAASNGNPLPTFRDRVSFPCSRVKQSKKKSLFLNCLILEDETDTMSLNVGESLPLDAA